jgi:hypothetical protein
MVMRRGVRRSTPYHLVGPWELLAGGSPAQPGGDQRLGCRRVPAPGCASPKCDPTRLKTADALATGQGNAGRVRTEGSKAGRSGAESVRSTWREVERGLGGQRVRRESEILGPANRGGWTERALRIRPPGGCSDDAGHRLQESVLIVPDPGGSIGRPSGASLSSAR